MLFYFFFFNDTATTEIYTFSLHDALPILVHRARGHGGRAAPVGLRDPQRGFLEGGRRRGEPVPDGRSEEHTSELQSQSNLVCRLLLEKKKNRQSCIY